MPKVTSINLYKDQVEKLKRTIGSKVIDFAIKRYKRHDFELVDRTENFETEIYAIRLKSDYDSETIRKILDAHFQNPYDRSCEIERLDKEIDDLLRFYTSRKYVEVPFI